MERWVTVRRRGRALFKARLADSSAKKARGITFSPPAFAPLLFDFGRAGRSTNSIHSFFCPIFDAVYLDARKRVTQAATIRPWRFFVPSRASRFLIELPEGEAKRLGLRNGIKLEW
ncbi:MAG: DUF192 domain-containing protein [Candidatus Micrarchaeota archaeon]